MTKRIRLILLALFIPALVVHISSGQSSFTINDRVSKDVEARDARTGAKKTPDAGEYVIKIGDIVGINVEGYEEDYNQTVLVQQNGRISYISLGTIQAADLTVFQLEEEIRKKLRIYISNPRVEVSIWRKELVIEPGDLLAITIEDNQNYDRVLTVQEDGNILYEPLGEIEAAGLVASQLEDQLEDDLEPYIGDSQVKISVEREDVGPPTTREVGEAEAPAEEIPPEALDLVEKLRAEAEKRSLEEAEEEAKKEYLTSPGDVIDIFVMENRDYSRIVVVQPDGNISYPPLGEVPATGFTEDRLSQKIATELSSHINNPQVKAIVSGRISFLRTEEADVGSPSTMEDEDAEYFIKPRDVIEITVTERSNYDQTVVVQFNGKVLYSPLGEIQAAGLTSSQLTDDIVSGLSARISDPEAVAGRVMVNVRQFRKITEEVQKIKIEIPEPPERFGYRFFTGARNRILKLEDSLIAMAGATGMAPVPSMVRDALSGFVGPMDMVNANVTATVPSKYVLGPGDRITLHFWSDLLEYQTVLLAVDDNGEIEIPKSGKMVVRGMTLEQFQEAAREELTRVAYKNLKLIATLDRLRSIQIFITGEAFRPGSYAVSAVTTLFNALYMCGGPSDNGSLRRIKLLTGGRYSETKTLDFYKFLMDGDSSQDFSLNVGDTIFIPPIERTAMISGEVKRPAVYELKEGENLLELVSLAGGIRPSGFLQRVQIDSVDPGRGAGQRIVIDADLSQATAYDQPNPSILDGDTVTVFSIPSERMNTVTIEGKVRMSGVYQLKEGMRVADLINMAQGLLGEAHMERADLLRLNPDEKTTKLISVNLSKALSGDEAGSTGASPSQDNVSLKQWDRLVVYSKWDVKWITDRIVSVHGAVQRPGSYERSDDMTIGDLLIQAGGALPDAYSDRALLLRLGERGELSKSVPVNLKDSGKAIRLEDGDTLLIYTHHEAGWEPEREVEIEGAVQTPGVFLRADDMKVSDLIHRAGGILPEAYPDRALLLRMDGRQRATQGFFISPKLALQDDPKNNLNLKDGDRLIIHTYEEAIWEPGMEVTITGAVQNPSTYERLDGMRVSDLILRAGGLLPNAYLERADIKRVLSNHETYTSISVNLAKVLSGDKEADVLLQDEDLLAVYTLQEAQYMPDNVVTIYGMVQRPDTYTRSVGMKLSDILFAAGGVLLGAHREVEIARIFNGNVIILTADIGLLAEGDGEQDVLLEDEDVISVRKKKLFMDTLRTVKVSGEVRYPGSYALEHDERLSDLIQRAGGLTDRAYPESSVITREINNLVLEEQRRSIQQVNKLLNEINGMEYWRELAKAQLERRRGTGAAETATDEPITPVTGLIMGAAQATVGIVPGLTVGSIPGQTEGVVSSMEDITQGRYTLVTPARKVASFLPSGRLILDVSRAIKHPGSKDDIILEDKDEIVIPAMSAAISVSGAVIQPSSLVYIEGKKVKDYVKMVGGYSRDADEDAIYVIKANGMVVSSEKAKLGPGDLIIVPTKIMVEKVTDRWGQIIGAVKFAVTTLAMVYTIKLIADRI